MIPDPNNFDQLGRPLAESILRELTQPIFYRNFGWTRRPLGNKRLARWLEAVDKTIYDAKRLNRKVTPVRPGALITNASADHAVRRAKRWVKNNKHLLPLHGSSDDLLRAAPGHIRATLKTMLQMAAERKQQAPA